MRTHKREWLADQVEQNMAILQGGVERMRGAAGVHLEAQRIKLCTLADETLKTMDACFGLLGPLEDDLAAMDKFLASRGPSAGTLAIDHGMEMIDSKIMYFARDKDAETIADKEELLAAKMHIDGQVIRGVLASATSALDMSEIEAFTLDLLHRTGTVKCTILGFQTRAVAADELWPLETKSQLEGLYRCMKRRNYTKVFPMNVCGVCLEKKSDCEGCNDIECDGQLCTTCFASQALKCAEENFNDPERLARVANLSCWFCKSGAMNSNIVRQMRFMDFELWEDCVRMQSMSEKAAEMAAETLHELTAYRGLPSSEKLCRLEKELIGELIAIKCPRCSRKYGDFDACAALTCHCGAHFCALCNAGPFDDDNSCHAHVESCADRPVGMSDSLFVENALWRRHVADRQQRQVREYLASSDLTEDLKKKLLEFFSTP